MKSEMKKSINILLLLIIAVAIVSCSKDDENDTLKPEIDLQFADAFPGPCDTLYAGESFTFRAIFTDNEELKAFNLELHHNFDQHTHGSHNETCAMDPVKEPVNPFYLNQNLTIPAGSKAYEAAIEVEIPADADTGDYHFMVKVTDAEGWQSWQSVSVKVAARP
jgi:hypothetical protein